MRFPALFSAIFFTIAAIMTLAAGPANATCVGGSCSLAGRRPAVTVLRGVVRGPVRVVQVIRHRERFRLLPWRRAGHCNCCD